MSKSMRLQKFIAHAGITSRRKAEALIEAGKVKVNGQITTEFGTKVDPKADIVEVEGKLVSLDNKKDYIYIALNKPVDYVCSTTSEQGKSVLELLKRENYIAPKRGRDVTTRVYPVGRLDKDSEGLVLLTNDGELANQLMHPRYEHEKEYELILDRRLGKDAQAVLQKGMDIGDGEHVKGLQITKLTKRGKRWVVQVTLEEGKNRQLRRMFGRLGYTILSLKRIRIGKLALKTLPPGRWVFVQKKHIV